MGKSMATLVAFPTIKYAKIFKQKMRQKNIYCSRINNSVKLHCNATDEEKRIFFLESFKIK